MSTSITKQGILLGDSLDEIGMNARYVRDTTSGSTKNTANHWCEIEIYNDENENIALNKAVNGTSGTKATDGVVNSTYLDLGSGTKTATIDLGQIEKIVSIKIWHYYPDGRTYYDNVTEVSIDGENWITVYQGEKPETELGNEILLTPSNASIGKDGQIRATEFYEI